MQNKLRILLLTPWTEFFLGAETHTYTLARELIRLGHDVSIFCFLKGVMWEKMKNTGATLLEDIVEDKYDLAIMNGNPCMPKAPKSAMKIFISNGVIPPQEQPVPGADKYVAISEEVSNNLETRGYSSVIIRNGIDCERFKSTRPVNKKLKNVLLISNKQTPVSPEFKKINEACKKLKLNLTVLSTNFGTSQWNVEEFINLNDLVISLGRGVYEAMACQKNALVLDYQGNDGMITNKSYFEIRKNNCSGRRYRGSISVNTLIDEFKKYDPEQGKMNRQLILKDHDIKKTVQQFLKLYDGK